MKQARSGGVGAVWHAVLGPGYQDALGELIQVVARQCKDVVRQEDIVVMTHPMGDLRARMILRIEHERLMTQTIYPLIPPQKQSFSFDIDDIEVWENGVEAVINGSWLNGRSLSFFCQNYLSVRDRIQPGQTVLADLAVFGYDCRIVPVNERSLVSDQGPLKGQTVRLDMMRYLNHRPGDETEACEFFFPVQAVSGIACLDKTIHRIEGSILDDGDAQLPYDVCAHPDNIRDREQLVIGEPLLGYGWLQGEIVLPSL